MIRLIKGLFLFLIVNLFWVHETHAQKSISLTIESSEESKSVISKYRYERKAVDSLAAIQTAQSLINQLHNDGYLLATITEIDLVENQMRIAVAPGSPFQWLILSADNIEKGIIRKTSYREKRFKNSRVDYNQIARIENGILSYAEENGYPFAAVSYDSLKIVENQLSASLKLELGPLIKFDSVEVLGEQVLKSRFVTSYLGISLGAEYNQNIIDGVVQKLSRLPYLRLVKSPSLTFQNSEAKVTLSLEKRPINTIDGIIGFLPNTSRDNGLLITGQFDLELYNPFATGKKIGLHWRRLSEETQSLRMNYFHPNALRSPLSVDVDFEFLKQDTTFTRRDFQVDFSYDLSIHGKLSFFTNFRATDLLATSQFENANSLPDIVDFSLGRYGLSFGLDYLDDVFLPKNGFKLELSASVGNKTIRQNADLPTELYRGVDLKTLQYQYDLSADHYLAFNPKHIFYSSLQAGVLSNDRLFRNDAYRLGGLNTIRGFSENFFFATSFAFSTLESRVFFDETSYLSLFSDFGYIKGDFEEVGLSGEEFILGIGAGINFSTGNGIFNFVYALGTSESTGGLNFNQSKIHFGYTTRF
ncbi:ShlB/FhaC/HecB family hemolysin secretion/activation protein [Roseivirga sp.]|uniref:ShlB/FhaC/HecB family hemolysin secretion/activation protein n=1 Tax=Roseivirga sp. TaxID=1964215 RepID=UPI003B8C372B